MTTTFCPLSISISMMTSQRHNMITGSIGKRKKKTRVKCDLMIFPVFLKLKCSVAIPQDCPWKWNMHWYMFPNFVQWGGISWKLLCLRKVWTDYVPLIWKQKFTIALIKCGAQVQYLKIRGQKLAKQQHISSSGDFREMERTWCKPRKLNLGQINLWQIEDILVRLMEGVESQFKVASLWRRWVVESYRLLQWCICFPKT